MSLKILVFNWRDPMNPSTGGAETYTYEVLKRWVAAGHEATWFAAEFPSCKTEEFIDGIRIVRAGGKYSVYWKAKKLYNERFRKEGYDVVIDEINTRPFFTQDFVRNEKVIAFIHQLAREFWFYETMFPLSFFGFHYFEDRWLRKYTEVPTVTVSNSTKEDLVKLGFRKVLVIPPACNSEPLKKVPVKTENPTIISVGRMTRAKRPEHVIKVFNNVKTSLPSAELYMVGSGPALKELRGIAPDGAQLLGRISNQGKFDLLRKSWYLVHCSVREGFPVAILEAFSCGTPCIAYDSPGLRDAVSDGETGYLVKSGDVEALGKVVFEALSDRERFLRQCENALKEARRFTWDSTAKKFLEFIVETLN